MIYFSENFWRQPGIFLHYFQIITNFMYVCHSFSWLTSLLKLCYYRDISCCGRVIFLIFLETFLGCFLHYYQIIMNSWMSVRPLVGIFLYRIYANKGISPVLDEIYFWIYLNTFAQPQTYPQPPLSFANGQLLGGHYNPRSYYYSTTTLFCVIAIYSPGQQKKINY